MKVITQTHHVYPFSELSPEAKERAVSDYATSGIPFHGAEEYLSSLRALAEHFGGKLTDYEIDWVNSSYSSAEFTMPEIDGEELTEETVAEKLAALGTFDPDTLRGNGDCELTGFCADEDAIDGFRAAWHAGERDLEKLMQSAYKTWIKAAWDDAAHQFSEEGYADECEANDYQFFASGKFFTMPEIDGE